MLTFWLICICLNFVLLSIFNVVNDVNMFVEPMDDTIDFEIILTTLFGPITTISIITLFIIVFIEDNLI